MLPLLSQVRVIATGFWVEKIYRVPQLFPASAMPA
jgi:hypothetical protein